MRRIFEVIGVGIAGLALGVAVVGCSRTSTKDKMSGGGMSGNMSGDKMPGKMEGDKMGDKMSDKMDGGKMKGGKMKSDKMKDTP
jgi:hypothetical protein